MLNWLIRFSLANRLLVGVLACLLIIVGIHAVRVLPIDAFPDTTPVQVQINTTAPSLSPEEMEQQVTLAVELALGGLPGLQNVRSISKFGLSQVVATFEDHTSIFLARQLIMERLQSVELPFGIERPQLGPIATGLGEVFHYTLRSDSPDRTLTELRELHDWIIKPELRKVPGVAEVNAWGGFEKQYHVVTDPQRLVKYGLTFGQLSQALQANNQNVGGGQVVRGGEALLVQGQGLATSTEAIAQIVIASHDGFPVRVRDVATVKIDHEIRRGAVTANGRGEVVLGLGFMLLGENSHEVTRALNSRLERIREALPPDVVVEVMYDRSELVDKVIRTVEHNLLAGALMVIAVLFAFLGNLRAGLIVALAIPLSMLFAGRLMLEAGIAASLLSLGAVDFGLIVDGSVVMVENCMRRLAERQQSLGRLLTADERRDVLQTAPLEVARPVAFGVGIILIVFLPILTLEGVEGKLFKPMALTMVFALMGSLVIALTLMPVLSSLFLPRRVRESDPQVVRWARLIYQPLLSAALRHRRLVLVTATSLVVAAAALAFRLGGEFLPRLGEQALAISTVRLAGIDVDEAVALNTRIEQELLRVFPDEIRHVWTRLGTAEVATDPMGVELSDFFITLNPRAKWTQARTQDELVEKMDAVFRQLPGMTAVFSQPIEMRMNELIAGIKNDIGIKIYGDDLDELRRLSDQVQQVLLNTPGAIDVTGEQLTGQPVLAIQVNPQAIARLGIPVRSVLEVVEAVGTRKVGEIREGQRRFPLVVRLPDPHRTDPAILAQTLIPTEAGPVVSLDRVAWIRETEGPATINREWGKRRITVQCNVRDRDVAGFVAEARRRLAAEVRLPEGSTMDWGGQFENMERAFRTLTLVVPLALGLILVLLYFGLRSVRDVLIVATGIPLGAVGGIAALCIRDMPLTVSAAVGFVALSGIAILNGLVLLTSIRQQTEAGLPELGVVRECCMARLRPVLMTALVAGLGFLPMAVNVGVGGEVQRPLATVVIGGILSNTLLTLVVLPVLLVSVQRRRGKEKETLAR